MTTVATSTVNIIGFFIIIRGFSFTNDCFKLSITCSFGNKEADLLSFISSLIQYYKRMKQSYNRSDFHFAGFHGLSEQLYEYTSCAANNGSGFEGLGDNTYFWNYTCGIGLQCAGTFRNEFFLCQ
jgi:hypothetical protein